MKKLFSAILCLTLLLAGAVPALADGEAVPISADVTSETEPVIAPSPSAALKIVVSGTELDTSALPKQAYYDGETLMVPLRLIAEALGYSVGWDTETREISVDDNYIQACTLKNGSAAAAFKGRLEYVDLSREFTMSRAAVIIDGTTYVSVDLFGELLCDTTVADGTLTVAPSTVSLDGAA